MICYRRKATRVKKVYKIVGKPAVMYGLETAAMTKIQETKLDATELKIIRFPMENTVDQKTQNKK